MRKEERVDMMVGAMASFLARKIFVHVEIAAAAAQKGGRWGLKLSLKRVFRKFSLAHHLILFALNVSVVFAKG